MKDFLRFIVFVVTHTRRHVTMSKKQPIDYWLLVPIVLLSIFGVVMVYNTSVPIAIREFADPYYFIRDQLLWLVLGMVLMIIFSRIDYHVWYAYAVPLLLATLFLLIAVFFPVIGVRVMGASRWIRFGFIVLQPAEFAKLAVSIYLASWLSTKEKERFGAFLLFLGGIVGLVIMQPDLGTSIILLCIALCVYVGSGSPLRQLVSFAPFLLVIVAGLAIVAPYRLARVTTFLNPDADPLGASYQSRQAIIAVGSGGWTGVGLGKSRQKYEYLPEANTDAIFAVIAEELGFIGSFGFLLTLFLVLWRGFLIVKHAPDLFGQLLGLGIVSWFGFQSVINIGAIVKLVPLTGVPLPLISAGGSSMVVLLCAFGILLNISRYRHER